MLGRDLVLALARQRAAQRAVILATLRDVVYACAEAALIVEPFEHGDFFATLRYEINEIEAKVRPNSPAADRRYRKKISQARRLRIYTRDDFTCQRCGYQFDRVLVVHGPRDKNGRSRLPRGGITIDHVIPESEGGATIDSNLETCCGWCNTEKGNRLPEGIARNA